MVSHRRVPQQHLQPLPARLGGGDHQRKDRLVRPFTHILNADNGALGFGRRDRRLAATHPSGGENRSPGGHRIPTAKLDYTTHHTCPTVNQAQRGFTPRENRAVPIFIIKISSRRSSPFFSKKSFTPSFVIA